MTLDLAALAAAATTILAPYTPFLLQAGKAGSKKLAEVIAAKGGEAAWQQAQSLWNKLTSRLGDDLEVTSAATMVAVQPEDETRQTLLAQVLAARLQAEPELAEEIAALLGGGERVQQVLAERQSWVEQVTQQLEGNGRQTVQASDRSVIKGVQQTRKR